MQVNVWHWQRKFGWQNTSSNTDQQDNNFSTRNTGMIQVDPDTTKQQGLQSYCLIRIWRSKEPSSGSNTATGDFPYSYVTHMCLRKIIIMNLFDCGWSTCSDNVPNKTADVPEILYYTTQKSLQRDIGGITIFETFLMLGFHEHTCWYWKSAACFLLPKIT